MLTHAKDLLGFRMHTSDGDIGHVQDLYFDDERWMVRYVVVDTRHWLPGRQILVSPVSVVSADRSRRRLETDLTVEQIRNSPDIDTDKPVSRQHEIEFHEYFSLPVYWAAESAGGRHADDPRLRSLRALLEYTVTALDRDVGRADDVLVDNPPWEIRYVVVDTSHWLPGRRILVPSTSVALISGIELAVHVRLTGAVVRNAPPYDPSRSVSAREEARLLEYYALQAWP
jgi:hypothetical protein